MSSWGFFFAVFVGDGTCDGVAVGLAEALGDASAVSDVVGDAEGVTVTANVGLVVGAAVGVVLLLFTKIVMTPLAKIRAMRTASSFWPPFRTFPL